MRQTDSISNKCSLLTANNVFSQLLENTNIAAICLRLDVTHLPGVDVLTKVASTHMRVFLKNIFFWPPV